MWSYITLSRLIFSGTVPMWLNYCKAMTNERRRQKREREREREKVPEREEWKSSGFAKNDPLMVFFFLCAVGSFCGRRKGGKDMDADVAITREWLPMLESVSTEWTNGRGAGESGRYERNRRNNAAISDRHDRPEANENGWRHRRTMSALHWSDVVGRRWTRDGGNRAGRSHPVVV